MVSARLSAFVTLELAISGSGALPIPAAFHAVGWKLGLFLCFLSTLLNCSTTLWLLEAAVDVRTGRCASSFSSLGDRAGFGIIFKGVVEVSTLLLMFGSYAACLAAFGETSARAAVVFRLPSTVALLIRRLAPGVGILVSVILGNRDYSGLFAFSVAGVLFLIGLVTAVVFAFFVYGPTDEIKTEIDHHYFYSATPQALTTLNYSLYIAPFALSMLGNLSHHEDASQYKSIVHDACIACFFATFSLYALLGIFGCLWKGPNTPGDIATAFNDNIIVPATTVYLLLSLLPMYHPLEDSVRGMLILANRSTPASPPLPRFISLRPTNTKFVKAITLALLVLAGLLARSRSNVLFSLTGATGVAVTCYVVPVLCYWRLHSTKSTAPPSSLHLLAAAQASNKDQAKYSTPTPGKEEIDSTALWRPLPRRWWTSWKTARPVLLDICLPFIALAFGLVISCISLFLTLSGRGDS